MAKFKWEFGFDHTFTSQIELLPRITIRYGGAAPRVFALEWLWFSAYIVGVSPATPRPRKVVCAALRHSATGALILGARHYDAIMRKHIRAAGGHTFWNGLCVQQGFIDQWGVFMSRAEAAGVAIDADQLGCAALDRMLKEDVYELYSEDLY